MGPLYRVQDCEGRGPYRPGLSASWADYDAVDYYCPPFFVELGWPLDTVPERFTEGWYGGCAFRKLDAAYRWFSPVERRNLAALGYRINVIQPDRIIAETPTQVVFECRRPLASFWDDIAGSLTIILEAA